jgi:hypothetical protein
MKRCLCNSEKEKDIQIENTIGKIYLIMIMWKRRNSWETGWRTSMQ